MAGRSGRGQRKRLLIKPVPVEGRPAEFLGGVGRFSVSAEASPKTVRVGQELEFRINVTGPAAWGMSGRPDLARYQARNWACGSRLDTIRRATNRQFERSFIAFVRRGRAILSCLLCRSHHLTRRSRVM